MLGAAILRIKDDTITVKNNLIIGDKVSISENGLTAPDFIIGDKVSFTDKGVTAKGFSLEDNTRLVTYINNEVIIYNNEIVIYDTDLNKI